jgi:hypothetical protein
MTVATWTRRRLAFTCLAVVVIIRPTEANTRDQPRYDPTDRYEARSIEGWSILVNKAFLGDRPELADRVFTLLRQQLYQITRRVPPPALKKLQSIRIWVEEREPHHPCMAYHPNPAWLRDHEMNPEKGRCVEIANAQNFLRWTIDQPWMVLHELAHGYHHQFLAGGFKNADVKAAFDGAMSDGLYKSVLRIGGTEERAYAATDPQEYFAEASEAFFGTNDFYPFVRAELQRHDPKFYARLEQLWGER